MAPPRSNGGSNATVRTCQHCHKPETALPRGLLSCAKCRTTLYCNRTCLRADWKAHKKTCNSNNNNNKKKKPFTTANSNTHNNTAAAPTSNSGDTNADTNDETTSPNPYRVLSLQHNRAVTAATIPTILLSAYLLRLSDELHHYAHLPVFLRPVPPDTVLSVHGTPLRDYQRFLDRAEAAEPRVLPRWWGARTRQLCEAAARYGKAGGGKEDVLGGSGLLGEEALREVTSRDCGLDDAATVEELRGLGVAICGTDVVRA